MSKAVAAVFAGFAVLSLLGGSDLDFVGSAAPRVSTPTLSSRSLRGDSLVMSATQDADVEAEGVTSGQFLRAAVSMVAALLVAFLPMAEAQAARSGGRIGGSAPRMRAGPRRAPPPKAAPGTKERVIERNSTTIVTPGYGGGYGYGGGMMFARPSLGDVVAGAAVQGAVSGAVTGAIVGPRYGGGPTQTDRALEGQLRQDERLLDQQANEINDLKRQIAELQAKK
eukprot:CAMPEP_0178420590 /NCGR_PEP_ID=MMETSP0689_2-20121128/26211_1 /TAXON_ID=160604 /ORGANISM="Amphidinium massartii, Strain CS-259" /LENGTH=224 /DNA_ID=CAMNT_0020042077 /DNA_START=110 /DNA_END=784 /DNA_ORIENTATION=-